MKIQNHKPVSNAKILLWNEQRHEFLQSADWSEGAYHDTIFMLLLFQSLCSRECYATVADLEI